VRRRDILKAAGFGAAALALPRIGLAQEARIRLVGTLIAGVEGDPISLIWANAVQEGLALEGWVEGNNVHMESASTPAAPMAASPCHCATRRSWRR
jgi:hypothetical protein